MTPAQFIHCADTAAAEYRLMVLRFSTLQEITDAGVKHLKVRIRVFSIYYIIAL